MLLRTVEKLERHSFRGDQAILAKISVLIVPCFAFAEVVSYLFYRKLPIDVN